MTFEELQTESKKDLIIENNERLEQESFKNQIIKPKYLEYKSRFELLLYRAKGDYQKLYRDKWEYYGGKADAKVYAAKPFDLKVLKNDLHMYINADDDIIGLSYKISRLETIIKYIEGVLKSIDNRGWDIRHAQDWKKFEAGMI